MVQLVAHSPVNTAVRAVVPTPGKAAPLGVLCLWVDAFTLECSTGERSSRNKALQRLAQLNTDMKLKTGWKASENHCARRECQNESLNEKPRLEVLVVHLLICARCFLGSCAIGLRRRAHSHALDRISSFHCSRLRCSRHVCCCLSASTTIDSAYGCFSALNCHSATV